MGNGVVPLSRGDGWVMCCICFAVHHAPYPDLYVDRDGVKWDFCMGACTVGALGTGG